MVEPSQRRLILAAKVGIATMLTTLLTLLDGVYAFNELGAWATITRLAAVDPNERFSVRRALDADEFLSSA